MNKVLEVARTEKLIGSSLEAKVYLHTLDDSLAARLNEMTAAKNDADTLHRIFITSQVISVPLHELFLHFPSDLTQLAVRKYYYAGQVPFSVKHNERFW